MKGARGGVVVAAAAVAAFAPLVVRRGDLLTASTEALLLLLAAIGLNLAMGYAGSPSLGQGGFAALGAYTTVILVVREGWDLPVALAVGTATAGVGGMLVARGVARLRPAFVAIATWLFSWGVSFAIAAFPSFTGGTRGVSIGDPQLHLRALGVGSKLGPVAFYEIALAFVVLAVLGTSAILRRYGATFAAVRSDPSAARAAGVPVDRVRFGAIVGSAAVGGFAGGLLALNASVADPTSYGPLLSVKLFVVVLLGGAGYSLGPAAGIVAVLAVSKLGTVIATSVGGSSAHAEPFIAAAILAGILAVGTRGLIDWMERFLLLRRSDTRPPPTHEVHRAPPVDGGRLQALGVAVSFGGVIALDNLSIDIEPGTCHVVIGPNGSGKTTFLRVLGGAIAPDRGAVYIDGQELADADPTQRAHAGIARTLQRTAVAPELTVLDYVLSGVESARSIGPLRALVRSPAARRDEALALGRARQALETMGLAEAAGARTETLSGAEQRILQIARALASGPRVLLLDEPAAGIGVASEGWLRSVIEALRASGLTIVIVEHNLRLVSAVADRVSVLDAGRLIASGSVAEVAADAAVQSAYLGPGVDMIGARASSKAPDRARPRARRSRL
jgi:branched-chain amino acid transport system permease protein